MKLIKISSPGLLIRSFFAAFLFLAVSQNVFSQFGQNKVQYKVFDWKYLQSQHFDVYFNQGGEFIAQFTAVAAESSLVSLENNIGYGIKNRIPILVFNSHNEFQQNNAVDEYLSEGIGGVTELFKNRIVVPFEGDYDKFRHVIHHELLHAYMNDLYYGGSIQNIISQNIALQFPGWFSEGMAEYQSLGGMDKANDMFIRDAVIYEYLPQLDYIDGYLSYRGGQSFFSWLADEYGKEKIGDLMIQIKALGDVDEGFIDVYNLGIEKLSEKWHKSLKQTYWPDINTRQELNDFAMRLTDSRQGDGFYNTAPSISPKGDKVVFISNRDDYFSVYIADIKSGRIIKKLIGGNQTADFEELHLLTPGLCWSPNGKKIAISVKSGAKDAIYIIDAESGDEQELPIEFDGIFSVDWNPVNNSLVLRGDNSRQSDIWIYDLKLKRLERVTNDLFSDIDPKWSRDGKKIFFSSDRGIYTNLNEIPADFDMNDYDYKDKDLYVYDVETKTLTRFTEDKHANESSVVSSADGKKVLYVSDRNGIDNIWLRDLESGEERPITNSIDPISLLSLSADGKRLAFTSLNRGGYDIFYLDNPFDIDLGMKELPNTPFVQKRVDEFNREKTFADSMKTIADSLLNIVSDTNGTKEYFTLDSSGTNLNDSSLTSDSTKSIYGNEVSLNLDPDKTDTIKQTPSQRLKLKEKNKSKFQITDNTNPDGSYKVNNYKIKFSPDLVYSNANYSSFYGVQGLIQMAFSDVTGDHRIYAALSAVLDLKNSDYAFAYYYLPKRIDYGISAYHSARFLLIGPTLGNSQLYRYRTVGTDLSVSYPLSKFNRIDGALSYNHLTKENMDNPLEPTQKLDFVMPAISYVHDNTLWGYTAPIKGTRYNITLLGTPKIGSNGVSFFSAIGDYRTYFDLADDYTFVLRLNGGYSFGKNPQRFYIGGTESWINYEIQNDELPIEEIQDFAFSTPVMPLRGYNYNTRSGSKFALMNAEFRFPLFRYLILGLLPFGFQNIQGVLFADAGSVWSDNKKLQLFQNVNGFQTKDLLLSMGIGTRLFFLYFPMKLDIAWTYDMQKFSQPRYMISIGADF
ncbi:MAG TPA: peptidase MA family metallohydrolase [Ignavibacteria bacterium]|nr:peptidase MA family metallohydrolase [Ignavibacteria bacterium]